MSPRQLHLLSLMARRARGEVGQISSSLGELRNREMDQFDMADRLGQLLRDTTLPASRPMTRGTLSTVQFMGQTLMQHLEETRAQMALTQEQRAALEADLQFHARRQSVLDARAHETRRALLAAREDASDNTMPHRRKA